MATKKSTKKVTGSKTVRKPKTKKVLLTDAAPAALEVECCEGSCKGSLLQRIKAWFNL
jgi:hypothetical protein